MGKASRAKRKRAGRPGKGPRPGASEVGSAGASTENEAAKNAMCRLVDAGMSGRLTLASAYALGCSMVALAHAEGDGPEWYGAVDPLDLVFLGAASPGRFRDAAEFGNARTAWFRKLRETPHWGGVECLVAEAVKLSEGHDLPIDAPIALLLLNTRLEHTKPRQRTLAAELRPAALLSDGRFRSGPPEDLVLPVPSAEAIESAKLFRAEPDTRVECRDSCVERLRDGLRLLEHVGYSTSNGAFKLLIALYAALVASNDEPVEQLSARALAWSYGLDEASSLIPVVDTIMIAAVRDLDLESTISRLFTFPAFLRSVSSEDQRWHSDSGTDFVVLALEFGHAAVRSRDREVMSLGPITSISLNNLEREFETEHGRPLEPGDRVFSADDVRELDAEMAKTLELAKVHPAWSNAYLRDNAPFPRLDGRFRTKKDHQDFLKSVEKYMIAHPCEAPPDHDSELSKLRSISAVMTVKMAIADDRFAPQLIALLDSSAAEDFDEIEVVAEFLAGYAEHLVTVVNEKPDIEEKALEWARLHGGASLAERLRTCIGSDPEDGWLIEPAVLLAIAVADASR